jgi:SAM-dependent methyltransferase
MNPSQENIPPQALRLLTGDEKAKTYETMGGSVASQVAAHNLSLLPPLPENALVHDNACGPGVISRHLLANGNPQNIMIYATDIDPAFISSLACQAKENKWPIETSIQNSEALTFPDNYFDLSIMNFAIFFTSEEGLVAAKEIYRTLKPGGTAMVNCWGEESWLVPILAANDETRPGRPFPTPLVQWSDGKHIQKIMKEAGFKDNITIQSSKAWITVKKDKMREWAESLWALVGGMVGWAEGDEGMWNKAVDKIIESASAQPGMEEVGDEVRLHATQWVVIAQK